MKDDCEDEFHFRLQSQGCISKKVLGACSPVYMQTHAQAHIHTETQTHECMYYKGNSLKSLSREVVLSAALFTRLMPRCAQE